jgi:hypothetical protein
MSIYLLLVIGFKGGPAVAQSGITGQLITSVGAPRRGSVICIALFGLRAAAGDDPVGRGQCSGCDQILCLNLHLHLCHGGQPPQALRHRLRRLSCGCGGDDGSAHHHVCALVGRPHTQRALNSDRAKHVLRNGSIVLLFGLFLIRLTRGQEG